MQKTLISQRHILILLNSLAVVVTILAVLGAFIGLAGAIDDSSSSLALRWACGGVSVLLAANLILLVAALAVRETQSDASHEAAANAYEPSRDVQLEATQEATQEVESESEAEPEIDLERERRLGGS